MSLTWKCRWFQNGNFFFHRFILSFSIFFFLHRLFFHSSANPYSFFGCTHAMLFRMTFACIIFHLNIFVRFEYETILFASYVTTFMRFIFLAVQFLVSMRFVQIFVWMVKSFRFLVLLLLSPAAFKEKTLTKERFVLEHDILHGHIVLYVIFPKWCWFHVGCLVSFPRTKEKRNKRRKKPF